MDDILIGAYCPQGITNYNVDIATGNTSNHTLYTGYTYQPCSDNPKSLYGYFLEKSFLRIPQNDTDKRYIGYKVGENLDGSWIIKLLTNDLTPYHNYRNMKQAILGVGAGYYGNLVPKYNDVSGEFEYYYMNFDLTTATVNKLTYGFLDAPNYVGQNRGVSELIQSFSDSNIFSVINGKVAPMYYNVADDSSWIEDYCSDMTLDSSNYCTKNYTNDKDTTVTFGINNFNRVDGNGRHSYMEGSAFKYNQWNRDTGDGGLLNNINGDILGNLQNKLNYYFGETQHITSAPSTPQKLNLNSEKTLDGNFYFTTSCFGIDYWNLHITEDYQYAQDYLNNGTVPPDDKGKFLNPDSFPKTTPISPDPTPETPSDNVGNKDDNMQETKDADFDKDPQTGNTINSSAIVPGINWYRIERGVLQSFIQWFWWDSLDDWASVLFNAITGLYGNLQNAIISLRKYQVNQDLLYKTRQTAYGIKLGRFEYTLGAPGADCQEIVQEKNTWTTVASMSLNSNNSPFDTLVYKFLAYAPYSSFSIYLPFVGIVPVDINLLMNKQFAVECIASPLSGDILYRIKSGTNSPTSVIATFQGKCSQDVPFSMESAIDISTNVVQSIGHSVASIATQGPIGAINLLGQDISGGSNCNTTITSDLVCHLPKRCFFIQQIPRYYKVFNDSGGNINDFAHSVGYKLNSARTITQSMGYIQVENPHYDTWKTTPTKEEIDDIYRQMSEGILM